MKTRSIPLPKSQLTEANIPRRFWSTGLDEVYLPPSTLKPIVEYVTDFAEFAQKSVGLIISGVEQCGKTSVACVVLKSLLARGKTAHYLRADDLVSLHFNREQDAYDYTYNDLLTADVLCVDDLAANGNAGYPIALGNLLRARFNAQKPSLLCLTTTGDQNLDVAGAFEADYGRELSQFIRNHFRSVRCEYHDSFVAHPNVGSGDSGAD